MTDLTNTTQQGAPPPAAALTEAERLLAAMTYFAPGAPNCVDHFTMAHDRACQYLAVRARLGATISPAEIRAVAEGKP